MRKTDVRTGVLDSIIEGIALLGSRHPLSGKDAGAGGARLVKTDVGWTARMRHATTAAPHLDHCDAVRPHAWSTRISLACLQAEVCRSLGRVPTRPSARSDSLF